jgi:glycyl-tRNA synthetase
VREFTMAEIEHFCDPRDKSHPKFEDVAHVEAALYSACDQMDGKPAKKTTIGQAVREVTIFFILVQEETVLKVFSDSIQFFFNFH